MKMVKTFHYNSNGNEMKWPAWNNFNSSEFVFPLCPSPNALTLMS